MSAPAKVNLFLKILAREESGYHQLETLFQALALEDRVLMGPGDGDVSLTLDGPRLGPPEENLAFKAAKAFKDAAGLTDGIRIHLEKRIPIAAGLGGGSSDAAAVLRGLNALFPHRLTEKELLAVAAGLGADVPFFLSPSPLALAWGRGHRLLPLPPLPRRVVLVAAPPLGVSTAEAYGMLARNRVGQEESGGPVAHDLRALSTWEGVARVAENDFQTVLFPLHPVLGMLREAMEAAGAGIALLSGSGSSLFGVFEEEDSARGAKGSLERSFPDTRFSLTHTLESATKPIFSPGVES
jgi:4-diphosphocytidyl-2-C-methyl-D-erythritol kinase